MMASELGEDAALAPRAIEELLRYDGPSGAQVRIVKVAQEMRGKELRAGDRVFIMLNAANRDPEAYEDPDRLFLARGVLERTLVHPRFIPRISVP